MVRIGREGWVRIRWEERVGIGRVRKVRKGR